MAVKRKPARRFPAEPLTLADVEALRAACSRRAPTGVAEQGSGEHSARCAEQANTRRTSEMGDSVNSRKTPFVAPAKETVASFTRRVSRSLQQSAPELVPLGLSSGRCITPWRTVGNSRSSWEAVDGMWQRARLVADRS